MIPILYLDLINKRIAKKIIDDMWTRVAIVKKIMQFLNFDFRKKDIDINIKIKEVNCLIISVEMKIKKGKIKQMIGQNFSLLILRILQ